MRHNEDSVLEPLGDGLVEIIRSITPAAEVACSNHLSTTSPPDEGTRLALEIQDTDGDEVTTGQLRAPSGLRIRYRPVSLDFEAGDDYVTTFSRQRRYVRARFNAYRRELNCREAATLFVHSTEIGSFKSWWTNARR
jgi:hypothetical protein